MTVEPRLPISVCIIAGNEASRIRRALDSVREWTSEIILAIDDQVMDGTDQIGQSYGARVISQPWRGHAAHRNFASTHATQPWLLAIDADEEVSEQLRDEMVSVFRNGSRRPLPAAFSFPRLSFFCGRWIRHGDWYPDRKVRLWQSGRAHWVGGSLHEKLVVEGAIGKLRGELLHYSMEDLDHYTRKSITVSNLFLNRELQCQHHTNLFELWFRPWWRFARSYFFRLGFLDGWQGYAIARMIAFETFLRYAKLHEAQLENDSDEMRS